MNGVTTFAVVEQKSLTQFDTIIEARLPNDDGIFPAELAAIKAAISLATTKQCKSLICTHSLSAIRALTKNHLGICNHILTLPDENQQVLILWVPSHIGIAGNECADAAAKEAQTILHVTEVPSIPRVIYSQFRAPQRRLHSFPVRPKYTINMTRRDCVMLSRLRVGKAKFNTKHYYTGVEQAKCTFCDVTLLVAHILTKYEVSKLDESLEKIFDCTTNDYLVSIKICLQKHRIQDV